MVHVATLCDNCGNASTGEDKYCRSCGNALPWSPLSAPSTLVSTDLPPDRGPDDGTRPGTPRDLRPNTHNSTVPPQQSTNGLAIASLVLGIIWIYWLGSILALVFGYIAKRQIDRSNGDQKGRGLAIAGIVLGWVGVGLGIAMAAFAVAVVALAGQVTNKSAACVTEKSTVATALEAYKAETGHYPSQAAAGGSPNVAMDLLDGRAPAPSGVGTLLVSVPADYTIDNAGNGSISAIPNNPGGCGPVSAPRHTAPLAANGATPVPSLTQALAAYHEGNIALARTQLQQIIAAHPTAKYALYNLGVIAQGTGDTNSAISDYKRAIAVDPTFESPLYNLGLLYFTHRNLKPAIDLLSRAAAANPNDANAHYNLGLALARLNTAASNRRAATELNTALLLNPKLINSLANKP